MLCKRSGLFVFSSIHNGNETTSYKMMESAWCQKSQCIQQQILTAGMTKNAEMMKLFIRNDKAYKLIHEKYIQGSPAYFQYTFYDLLAMIRQLDTPSWCVTLSSADIK